MGFERGQLYWLPKNGTVVEYVGAAAGGQQNVTNKETGDHLTVKTAELAPLDEAAYKHFLEEYEKQAGAKLSTVWEMDDKSRDTIQGEIQNVYPDFTLESEQQFEDWRDDMFHMHNQRPQVAEAIEQDNTIQWVIGGLLAVFLVTYK